MEILETALAEHEVHLWWCDLFPTEEVVAELRRLLTPDEIKRADRFKFDRHRRRFIVRRGVLRRLLATYVSDNPKDLSFVYGERDKPALTSEIRKPERERLEFNLSDSRNLALYAITRGTEVGADVEVLRPMRDAMGISEHYFSDPEREVLRALPPERVEDGFFRCWTRKEAYLKAIGTGLAQPLDSFVVTLHPDEEARFLHFDLGPEEVKAWSLYHLDPYDGAIGALAIRRLGWKIRDLGWILKPRPDAPEEKG